MTHLSPNRDKNINDMMGVSHNLNTICMIYRGCGDLDKAMVAVIESIKIKEQKD